MVCLNNSIKGIKREAHCLETGTSVGSKTQKGMGKSDIVSLLPIPVLVLLALFL